MKFEKSGYHGIILSDYGIGLDSSSPNIELNLISHAHADHVPRDRRVSVITTESTRRFMELRGFRGEIKTLGFLEPLETEQARITLYPAGHILGSAMIYVETDEGNLLYTGDFRTPPSPASEGFQLPQNVDYFITEATFGLPIYKWDSHEVIFEQIRNFASRTLDAGETPIFFGYNLGKAQEIMHALSPLNHPIQIHGAGYPLCQVYSDHGIDLGPYDKYNKDTVADAILVAPSSVQESAMIRNIRNKRIAYCSGWASHESRRQQMIVDELIPLSDHVDFFELLALIKTLQPRHTWVTHSPNPKVILHYLRELGYSASSLDMALKEED